MNLDESVIDCFKNRYKHLNYTTEWSPYSSKSFIELAYVVHENPKVKVLSEVKSTASSHHVGNIENYFSEVSTQTKLNMIFGTAGSDNSSALPKNTLIEGAPGIGKSVVAREIACRWSQNKMLPKIKLLLLIYLRTDMSRMRN